MNSAILRRTIDQLRVAEACLELAINAPAAGDQVEAASNALEVAYHLMWDQVDGDIMSIKQGDPVFYATEEAIRTARAIVTVYDDRGPGIERWPCGEEKVPGQTHPTSCYYCNLPITFAKFSEVVPPPDVIPIDSVKMQVPWSDK